MSSPPICSGFCSPYGGGLCPNYDALWLNEPMYFWLAFFNARVGVD
jgi:hypothetical protein